MAQATADLFQTSSLKFKGSLVPLTTIELVNFTPDSFAAALSEKTAQAPNLFRNLPVILSLERFEGSIEALQDFTAVRDLLRAAGMVLVGLRVDDADLKQQAETAGLPIFPPGKAPRDAAEGSEAAENRVSPESTEAAPTHTEPAESTGGEAIVAAGDGVAANRLITTPVRSGQQIYAPGGDLIVLAPVSAGAELLADGNIHVYGPLRGRALAGVRGLTSARIFCQSLEAELVSIAGHYKISEDLQGPYWKKPVQIALSGEKLNFTSF